MLAHPVLQRHQSLVGGRQHNEDGIRIQTWITPPRHHGLAGEPNAAMWPIPADPVLRLGSGLEPLSLDRGDVLGSREMNELHHTASRLLISRSTMAMPS